MPGKKLTPRKKSSSKSDQFRGSPKKNSAKLFGSTNPKRLAPKNPKRVVQRKKLTDLDEQFANEKEVDKAIEAEEENEEDLDEEEVENEEDLDEEDVEDEEDLDEDEVTIEEQPKQNSTPTKNSSKPASNKAATPFSPPKKKTKLSNDSAKNVPKVINNENSPERKRKETITRKKRSAAHYFFDNVDEKHKRCRFDECHHQVISAANTSKEWDHLDKHEKHLKDFREKADSGKNVEKDAEDILAKANAKYQKSHTNLDAFFRKAQKSKSRTARDMSFLLVVAENGWSFNSASSERFLDHMNNFHDSNYPTRKDLAGSLLTGANAITKMAVKEQLKSAKVLAITADGWKGRRMESYLGITAHWIDENFSLCSCVLGVVAISGHHTGKRISVMIRNVIDEYVSKDVQVSCIVSDNGADMLKAGDILSDYFEDFLCHSCFAHTLQLAINDVVGKGHYVKEINLVREIICIIRKSGILSEELEERLILDEPTRWNSTYYMLKSFADHRIAIKQVFDNHRYEKSFACLNFPNIAAITIMVEV